VASWIDAVASRSGPLIHAATHFTARHGLDRDPPRGVPGLRALSGLISSAQRQSAPDDETFVEGAGAYLGLLLLDHLPAGAHSANAGEHRLRFHPHGYFDPFAAVAEALDASDPRRALLDAVRLAEAEASGQGPTARAVAAVLARLRGLPQVRVVRHFDRRLWLDLDGTRVELDLERIVELSRGEPDSVLEHAVGRMCSALVAQASPALAWEDARERLFPRLVGDAFLSSLPDCGSLYAQPLGAQVWVTLVLRFGERARYVRAAEVETWSAHGAAARAQALHNLARSCRNARFLQHDTPHGPLVLTQSGDGLDSARLLLPGLHEVLAPALGQQFIVTVPHRDLLLACPQRPAALVELLAKRSRSAMRNAPHAISTTPWLISGPGQLRPLE
jgi:uncharacterized protein YtpQ (UPF0354 family)